MVTGYKTSWFFAGYKTSQSLFTKLKIVFGYTPCFIHICDDQSRSDMHSYGHGCKPCFGRTEFWTRKRQKPSFGRRGAVLLDRPLAALRAAADRGRFIQLRPNYRLGGGETTDLQGTDLARRGRIFCLTVLASQLGSFGKHDQYHISG